MEHDTLNTNDVKYLEWDSQFFGFSIGRLHAKACTEVHLRKSLEQAGKEGIAFVELFCDVSDSESIYSSEGMNFHLADTRLGLKKNPHGEISFDKALKGLTFKKAAIKDIDRLKIIGHGLFTGSRYYRYPGFDRDKVDLMFQIWIEKAVKGAFDDELYYLCDETGITAFISLRYRDNGASIGLLGVSESQRGKGLGGELLNRVSHMLHERRVTEVNVVTQGKNSIALRLYQKNGFYLSNITMCYYKWLVKNIAGTEGR